MYNVTYFSLILAFVRCDCFLLSLIIHDNKLNIFELWAKQDMRGHVTP